jgi:hypothetical protein
MYLFIGLAGILHDPRHSGQNGTAPPRFARDNRPVFLVIDHAIPHFKSAHRAVI